MKKALELRRAGKFQESNQLLQALLAEDPQNGLLHYECARGFDSLGDETKAIPYYEKAIELGLPNEELEYAFVGLGTIYRSHGRYLESKELFEEALERFWDKEQMHVFYAMTLYNLQEHAKAMESLIRCLARTTVNEDILKHHRTITYLSTRLDASSDKIVQLANESNGKMEKPGKSIVEKVTEGLKNVGLGYFDTGESSEYDDYYADFNDPDVETRKCALAKFTVMLGNWRSQCSFAFTPQHERKFIGHYNPDEPSYELNNYIEAFVAHHEQIEQEFPVMHEYIIRFLIDIEVEHNLLYEQWFPEVDAQLFKRLREDILIPKQTVATNKTEIKFFLKEAGIPPFFISDFFE